MTNSRRSLAALAGALLGAAPTVVWAPSASAAEAIVAPVTAAYRPAMPCRLVDTRADGGRPGTALVVAVHDRCGVPANAVAAIVTLTVPGAGAAGFVTAYPAGSPRPLASNLNVAAGDTVANGALVRLGDGGAIAVDSNVALHKVVDVVGWFEPAASAAAGRFVGVTPTRLLDTRTGAKVAPDGTVTAALTGVPADATGVAVNLTFTETTAPGFFTAYGSGARPVASTGNADAAGQTRALFTVVPASDAVTVYSQSGAHVVVDLVGWFTGPSSPDGTDGLLVAMDPTRAIDTHARGAALAARSSIEVPLATGLDGGGTAVWANVTTVDAPAPGFVTAWAAGTPRPGTSSVNAPVARRPVANAAVVALSDRGVAVYAQPGGHVVVDVAGAFTGTSVAAAPLAEEVIGTSLLGRPMVAAHRLDHPGATRKVLVLGSMHGNEQAGADVVEVLRTAPVPNGVDLWLMTTMNPDGFAAYARGNARGVDLNRNFDGGSFPWCPSPGCGAGAGAMNTGAGPLSEPESQAMWAFLQRERFDLVVSYHQPLNSVDCSPNRGATLLTVCAAYAAVSGIPLNNGGYIDISGTMTNSYMQANPGRWAFTMELPAAGAGDLARHVAAVWGAVAAL